MELGKAFQLWHQKLLKSSKHCRSRLTSSPINYSSEPPFSLSDTRSYETSDGVSRQESAVVNNLGSENEELAVKGSISWTAPDGQVITLNYIADKNGFQPQGDHIPQ